MNAWMFPSRGSSGEPRLAAHTRRALDAMLAMFTARLELDASSRLLCALPLHEPEAAWLGPQLARRVGATLILPTCPGDASELVDLVWRERPSHLVCSPQTIDTLLRGREEVAGVFARSDLRRVVCAPGALSMEQAHEAARVLARPLVAIVPEPSGGPPTWVEGANEASVVGPLAATDPASAPPAPPSPFAERVLLIAARVLKVRGGALQLADGPGSVPGWDSVAQIELLVALEAGFGIRLRARDFGRIRRLADAVALVERAATS